MFAFNEFARLHRQMNGLWSELDRSFDALDAADPWLYRHPFQSVWTDRPLLSLTSGNAARDKDQSELQARSESQPSTAMTTRDGGAGAGTGGSTGGSLSLSSPSPEWLNALKPITADIVEREKEYVINAELPGLTRNDVSVTIAKGVLTVRGERRHSYESPKAKTSAEEKEKDKDMAAASGSGASAGGGDGKAETKGAAAPDAKAEMKGKADHTDTKHTAPGQSEAKGQAQGQASGEVKPYFRRIERAYGCVERSFRLPRDVDESKVTAKHENGVLTLTLPKTEAKPKGPQHITIS